MCLVTIFYVSYLEKFLRDAELDTGAETTWTP